MPYFEGVYGFEINKKFKLKDIIVHPVHDDYQTVRELANDTENYFLTGLIEYVSKSTEISLFDLEGVLAFIDRKDVIITNKNEFKNFNLAVAKTPNKLFLTGRHNGGSKLIQSDLFFEKNYRAEFINSAINQLSVEDRESVLRKSFFKTIESYRARQSFLEISYYLFYSALESLARFDLQDNETNNSSQPIAKFLDKLGFDLKQDNSKNLQRAVSSYTHIRNELFHNSKHVAEKNINGKIQTLNIVDFHWHLKLLVPLVILKYMGYDDGKIRWDSWYDRMPY